MPKNEDLFSVRKGLDQICRVPDKIISVYSLEQHVWADGNAPESRKARQPELRTIEELRIDPVRPFLTDILRNMAAPYKPERRDQPIGQGYWIQAEFGSGKSHLLCFLAALALGDPKAWDLVADKEKTAERGKRESLYRFWEEGLEAKSQGTKGVFVIVKTLVGSGGGTVGIADSGKRLTEYVLDAAKEQLQLETGKNVSLYPVELLADRFLNQDVDRYRSDLRKFLHDPGFFEEDEFEDVDDFIRDIQENRSPEYKLSCGNKLWRFYTEYLEVQPQIAAESEDILRHLVETILAEGYCGVLLVLDEVSLFMKDRSEDQRTDDEKTLVVLSNRLAKVHNLPIWTVCSAQQAIESKMGVKNIIADDRLKLVKLLEREADYYEIVLSRVREVVDPSAVHNYYTHYRSGFTWPNSIGEEEFTRFFPFHKPALEVLRAITYELTTTRSAIHFMHQTLRHHIEHQGREPIRLWELFDEAVQYEEDPSGVHAGLVAIRTSREADYRAYEDCKAQIDAATKGYLKVYRDKAVKTVQTLFLYHVARTRQQGLTAEEIANSVLIERDDESTPDENNQHYETLAENLKKELAQVAETPGEDGRARYRFEPVRTAIDPRREFAKARDVAEANQELRREAWEHLLALDEWPVRTRQMTLDLSNGVRSIFRDVAPFVGHWEDAASARKGDQTIELVWQGREIAGLVVMRDLGRVIADSLPLPAIDTAGTDRDFAVFLGSRPASVQTIDRVLDRCGDPRVIVWTPEELSQEEQGRLLDFAAYKKMVSDWAGKEGEDAAAVVNWVSESLRTDMGRIAKIVDNSYARGRVDALSNKQIEFHVAGELASVFTRVVERVLDSVYESRDIVFERPFIFRKEEGVKVINGIVKTGSIPKGAKPNQNISAAQNFGFGLGIMKKTAERQLDVSDNAYVQAMWAFIDDHLANGDQFIQVDTLYRNFTGVGGPKDFGLTRRMVQIYLLCLVRNGQVRVEVSDKAGLPSPTIDYANIAETDFSAKVLDALARIRKMAKPENWDVLRPYAEKLLGTEIAASCDDARITDCRAKLRELFVKEAAVDPPLTTRARGLFAALRTENPYEAEVDQVAALFRTDLEAGDDIDLLLHGLHEALGYKVFETQTVSPQEVDDLANRLRNYRDVERLLASRDDLVAARAYCDVELPEAKELEPARQSQRSLRDKLKDLRPCIDSDVRLRTGLIGKMPPQAGEPGTLSALMYEYASHYVHVHEQVTRAVDEAREAIEAAGTSDAMRALVTLEGVTALQPPISAAIGARLQELAESPFSCPDPSPASVRAALRTSPVHACGLGLGNGQAHIQAAGAAASEAADVIRQALDAKLQVLLAPAVRTRLEQGTAEPVVAGLLACKDVAAVRGFLVERALADAEVVAVINRYLKRIEVRAVRIADFRPSSATVEPGQVDAVVGEFRSFLQGELEKAGDDDDSLPVLRLE